MEHLNQLKTPFYYYDVELLEQTLLEASSAAFKRGYVVHYAMKANSNPKVMQAVKHAGFGVDCVSGNEIQLALDQGYPADHIAFAGVGKTDDEINLALESGIFCLNVESIHELEVINELAEAKGVKAPIALRLNPDVKADTHHYITTGLQENKFGINFWELEAILETLKSCQQLELLGLHFHIGSQIRDLGNFKNLCTRVNEIQQWFDNHGVDLEHINVGGGLGVDYHQPTENPIPDFEAFFAVFDEFLELKPGQKLHFELGRSIVAQCGSLYTKVLYIKNGLKKNFAIVDAGMTELIRPALYQSYHKIENVSKSYDQDLVAYDVVGPICESSDCFGKAVEMPKTERGDLIRLYTAGAYGEVMVSSYNLRDKVQAYYSDELLVDQF